MTPDDITRLAWSSKIIRELAALTCLRVSDEHFDAEVLPREAVMAAVCKIRDATREGEAVIRTLAQQGKAGAVPLPMFPIESDGSYWSTTEIEVIRAYGDAREAAARDAGRADAVSMAQRFLRWRLPVTFAPDAGISFDRSYCEKWATWPTGTNLFTADEAADMMRFVLETSPVGAPPAQQPLDDSANNAGVATGSRNESPSESVTRGSPQVTTSPASAPKPTTTQGEAVATVCLIGERYAHGTMIEVQLQIVPGTELPIGTKLYAGSQP